MQKSKIEWTDYTCNPVKGLCQYNCPYCYAIRMYMRFKWNPAVRFDLSAFDGIDKLKSGSKVFIGSTHDIFGHWIPDNWILNILDKVKFNQRLIFIFLTKNPKRYNNFSFPKNAWLGYSTTGTLFHKWDEEDIQNNDNIKFVSLEPMQHRMDASLEGYAQRIDFDWLIVGQETGNRKEKHIVNSEELRATIEFARKAGMKVFVKNNLKCHFDNMMCQTLKELPQEFPEDAHESIASV